MPPGARERPGALGGDREADRDAEPDPGRGGQHVDDDRALARGTAARRRRDRSAAAAAGGSRQSEAADRGPGAAHGVRGPAWGGAAVCLMAGSVGTGLGIS